MNVDAHDSKCKILGLSDRGKFILKFLGFLFTYSGATILIGGDFCWCGTQVHSSGNPSGLGGPANNVVV